MRPSKARQLLASSGKAVPGPSGLTFTCSTPLKGRETATVPSFVTVRFLEENGFAAVTWPKSSGDGDRVMFTQSGCAEQVPSLPATAQERQTPVQALSQQTPLAQLPVRHSTPGRQACPVVTRQWAEPSHTCPLVQAPAGKS